MDLVHQVGADTGQAVFETVGGRDGHASGWSESLDNLAEYVQR